MTATFPDIGALNGAFERDPPERLVRGALDESGIGRIASAFQAEGR